MKTLKTWGQFFEAKNYTAGDRRKDITRINYMIDKAKDENHLLRLAQTMANSITNYDKAYNRGKAAEEAGFQSIADIFLARAEELKAE